MNAAFGEILPHNTYPWFDEYFEHTKYCKVYNDGSSYIAVPSFAGSSQKKSRRRIPTIMDDYFNQIYLEAIQNNVAKRSLQEYLLSALRERFPGEPKLEEYVEKKMLKVYRNLSARKKRFRRKAFLNPWNYFVTFTYNDELHDEESFRTRLRKCLSNLHTRRGWLYMGVFERAPETGRLHFHAIMYVPEGQMIGGIYESRDYSTRHHKMQVTHPNSFFEVRFGRNDFEALSNVELRRGSTIQYLLKYLEKTAERIVYSRGIPSEFYRVVNDDDVICEMVDFVIKYVLFDDVIDYDTDIKDRKMLPPALYYGYIYESLTS